MFESSQQRIRQSKKFTLIVLGIIFLSISSITNAMIPRSAIIDTALLSPHLVLQQNKQAWLNLFSTNAQVNDPVGAPTNQAYSETDKSELDNFWDVFIHQNTIIFHPQQEDIIVAGNELVRDVIIETNLGDGVIVNTPAYILYEITEENTHLKINKLDAFWQVADQTTQVLTYPNGLAKSSELFFRMINEQGLVRALSYSQALINGVFNSGKKIVRHFEKAIQEKNDKAIKKLLNSYSWFIPKAHIDFPVAANNLNPHAFLAQSHTLNNFQLSDLRASGWYISSRFTFTQFHNTHTGIVFFEFHPFIYKIKSIRFFWEK